MIGTGVAGSAAIVLVVLVLIGFTPRIGYEQQVYEPDQVPEGQLYFVSYATVDLSFEDMAFESPLIVQGKVIEQKEGRSIPPAESGMLRIPTTSNILQVEKVMKGDPKLAGQTINVVSPLSSIELNQAL